MEIIKKELTEEGVLLTLSSSDAVTRVLVDNASNYDKVDSEKLSDHSFISDFDQDDNKVTVHVNCCAESLIFITLFTEEDKVMTGFLNKANIYKVQRQWIEKPGCECKRCKCCQCHNGVCSINHRHISDYSNCDSCGNYGTYCRSCEDRTNKKLLLALMIRMELLIDNYHEECWCSAVKYYTELNRIAHINDMPFEYSEVKEPLEPGKYGCLLPKIDSELLNNSQFCANKLMNKVLSIFKYRAQDADSCQCL